ncbi:MAG: hypothetical protein ACOCX7_04550 [Bacteroidota bacterium]
MKIFFIIFCAFLFQSESEYDPDLREVYLAAFTMDTVRTIEGDSLIAATRELDSLHPLAGLINNNRPFFNYLINNFVIPAPNVNIADSLANSPEFNKIFLDCAGYYLYHRDIPLKGFAQRNKLKIPHRNVALIAARFFESYYNEYGQLRVRACPLRIRFYDSEEERYLPMEAFCYQAICRDLDPENSELLREYDRIVSEITWSRMPYPEDERLEFINTNAWRSLAASEALEQKLIHEFNSNRQWLPFNIYKK